MSWRNIEPNAYAVLNLLSEAESIIVLDTETTGVAKNAKIIQFSAIRYKINADFSLEQIDFQYLYFQQYLAIYMNLNQENNPLHMVMYQLL